MSPDPNSRGVGERGETLALKYLVKKRYTLLERNYQTRHGEVDLTLRDGTTLVFAEVKLRRGTSFGDPLEAVTSRKQGRIRQAAEEYLAEKGECFSDGFGSMRFDVVGILWPRSGKPQIRHLEDAF